MVFIGTTFDEHLGNSMTCDEQLLRSLDLKTITDQAAAKVVRRIINLSQNDNDNYTSNLTNSNNNAINIWDTLFDSKEFDLKPIGLAARDTLRIEMGYCLYGNDINEETSPEEANLRWITKVETSFIGHKIIENQIKKGSDRKLIGFKLIEKSIPRNGYEVFNIDNKLIGKVTSGTFSPVLKKGIGLAYINSINLKDDLIYIKIRNNLSKAEIVKTPFI